MPTFQPTTTPDQTPIPTPTAAPDASPIPESSALNIPTGLTIHDPIEAGSVLRGDDGTEIVVTAIDADALKPSPGQEKSEVKNQRPREEGHQFYLVSVGFANVSGEGIVYADSYAFRLVGEDGVVYYPYESGNSCGPDFPGRLYGELFRGGKLEGNLCFEIPESDDNFILIYSPGGYLAESLHYLRLDPHQLGSLEDLSEVSLVPTPESLVMPKGMRVENPVEAGGVLKGPDGAEVVVTGVVDDAFTLIKELDPNPHFLDPPNAGFRYYMVSLALAKVSGKGSMSTGWFLFRLVGSHRNVYYSTGCGGYIDLRLRRELYPGGNARGNVCFAVADSDSELTLIYAPVANGSASWKFLELDPHRVGSATDLSVARVDPESAAQSQPKGTSLDNPVEAGGVLRGTDGTEIVVTGIVQGEAAWQQIKTEHAKHRHLHSPYPPSEGIKYVLVRLGVANVSGNNPVDLGGSKNATEYDNFLVVGKDREVYNASFDCGSQIPNHLRGEIFVGGRKEGNICAVLPESENQFILIHTPDKFLTHMPMNYGVESRRFLLVDFHSFGTLDDLTEVSPDLLPESMALPKGSSVDNPVEAGEVLPAIDGSEIVVTGIEEKSNPETGIRTYRINMGFANVSSDAVMRPICHQFSLVGENRVVHPSAEDCRLRVGEVFYTVNILRGGVVEASVQYEVPEDDGSFILIYRVRDPFVGALPPRYFLRLDPNRVGVLADLPAVSLEPGPESLALPQGDRVDNPVEVGGILETGDGARIAVTEFDLIDTVPGPSAASQCYRVSMEVSNASDSNWITLTLDDFYLVGDLRFLYNFRSGAPYVLPRSNQCYLGSHTFDPDRLPPGENTEGSIYFNVLESDGNFVLAYQPGYLTDSLRFLSLE